MEGEQKDFEVEISSEAKEKSTGVPPPMESEEHVGKDKKVSAKGLKKRLEEKEEEVKTLYDRLLRTQAEFENYKKRMVKEKNDVMRYGNEELLKEILPAVDNLEIAIQHAREADRAEGIIEGVEIVLRQLLKGLERFGVRGFTSMGDKFDPNRHEAIVQVESTEHEPHTVVGESQKGYFLHDRLLRPALVTVSKAPGSDAEKEQ